MDKHHQTIPIDHHEPFLAVIGNIWSSVVVWTSWTAVNHSETIIGRQEALIIRGHCETSSTIINRHQDIIDHHQPLLNIIKPFLTIMKPQLTIVHHNWLSLNDYWPSPTSIINPSLTHHLCLNNIHRHDSGACQGLCQRRECLEVGFAEQLLGAEQRLRKHRQSTAQKWWRWWLLSGYFRTISWLLAI